MGDKVAFLYAPVGWQRPDMGRQLYEREAVFREALDAAAADLGAAAPDLLAALYPKAKGVYDGVLDGVRYAQPALFAVEVALDALLRSRGSTHGLKRGGRRAHSPRRRDRLPARGRG